MPWGTEGCFALKASAMDLLAELQAILAKLDEEKIPYALCGGLAMAVYALPRATLDIDLLIPGEALPRAREAVKSLGYTLASTPMDFHGGKVQIHRLCKVDAISGEDLVLDLLLVTPEIAAAWQDRQGVEWEGRRLTVLSPRGLILLKSFRRSGKDQEDIAHLQRIDDES
jgi:hypothetical protein